MKLVIDIPEDVYTRLFDNGIQDNEIAVVAVDDVCEIARALRLGTPLPKGYGRLIILSEDAVKREQTSFSFSCQNWISEVGLSNATVTIIKADSDEEEEV